MKHVSLPRSRAVRAPSWSVSSTSRVMRIAKGAAPNGRAVDAEHGLVLALQPHHVGRQGHHLYDHIGPHDAQRAGFGRTTEMTAAAPDARGIGGVAGQEMP